MQPEDEVAPECIKSLKQAFRNDFYIKSESVRVNEKRCQLTYTSCELLHLYNV